MNKLITLLLLCAGLNAWTQPTLPAPAKTADMTNPVSLYKYVSPGVLASNTVTVGGLKVGTGASTFTLTATNGPNIGGFPAVYWSQYVDGNTNSLYVSAAPQAGFVSKYLWSGSAYTNVTVSTRTITNVAGYWCTTLSGSILWSNITSGALFGSLTNWLSLIGQTNSTFTITSETNAVWGQLVWGGATNLTGITNGCVTLASSNGAGFLITSRVGATNQSRTNLWPAP